MRSRIASGVLLLALCCVPARAPASVIAYDVPLQTGNQAWTGSLGMDFNVLSPILVDSLGAFDSAGDGFADAMTVTLYNRATQTAVVSQTFDAGQTGTLVNGSRFLALPSPVLLPAGFQGSIVAWGYGTELSGTELNGNNGCVGLNVSGCTAGAWTLSTTNSGGGLIDFVGTSRYGEASSFPTNADSGPPNRYGAGTFSFAVPDLGSSMLLLTTGLIGLGALRKRLR